MLYNERAAQRRGINITLSMFSNNLKTYRLKFDLTQQKLAEMVGTSKSAISMYEQGNRMPEYETLEAFADIFNISMDKLMGRSEVGLDILSLPGIEPMPKMKKVPRLGTIACGEPILAVENYETYDEVPEYIDCDFALKCKGDSMVGARILDGDVVFIRAQPDVENGEVAAVLIGDEVTLKRVYKRENSLQLMPDNPAFEPIVYFGVEADKARILGRALEFKSRVR